MCTVFWFRRGAPALRCTICYLCLGVELMPQHEDVIYCLCFGLLPVSWPRSGAPALSYTICGGDAPAFRCMPLEICCRCLGGGVPALRWMHGLLPVSWSRSGARVRRCTVCCRCLGLNLLPDHVWLPAPWYRSGAPTLRWTICCQGLGIELVHQN